MKKFILCFSFLQYTFFLYSQDNCGIALQFKDKIVINQTGNTTQDIHNWFISQNGQEYASSDGWDGNIGFVYNGTPVKLGGGSTSNDYEKLVEGINSGNKSLFSSDFKNYIYKEILKPESYEKWLECIKSNNQTAIDLARLKSNVQIAEINSQKKGLIGEITEETEESFILKLKWVASMGVNSVKIRKPIVSGATYNLDAIDLNQEIGSEYVSIPFYKESGKNILIAINTFINGQGSFSAKIESGIIVKKNSFSIDNVSTHGFYMNQTPETIVVVNFIGKINVIFKTGKINSYDDLSNVELEGSFEGLCNKVSKMEYKGFGGTAINSSIPFTTDELNYKNNWIGQKIKIQFKAEAFDNIIANNQTIGLNFNVTQNILTINKNGSENTSQLEPNKLEVKIYFEKRQSTNNILPISISLNEKGIADNIYQKIIIIKN